MFLPVTLVKNGLEILIQSSGFMQNLYADLKLIHPSMSVNQTKPKKHQTYSSIFMQNEQNSRNTMCWDIKQEYSM